MKIINIEMNIGRLQLPSRAMKKMGINSTVKLIPARFTVYSERCGKDANSWKKRNGPDQSQAAAERYSVDLSGLNHWRKSGRLQSILNSGTVLQENLFIIRCLMMYIVFTCSPRI